jgi:hypothetical protein
MTNIDLLAAAIGIGAFIVLCAGLVANAHHWHDEQRRCGPRER